MIGNARDCGGRKRSLDLCASALSARFEFFMLYHTGSPPIASSRTSISVAIRTTCAHVEHVVFAVENEFRAGARMPYPSNLQLPVSRYAAVRDCGMYRFLRLMKRGSPNSWHGAPKSPCVKIVIS